MKIPFWTKNDSELLKCHHNGLVSHVHYYGPPVVFGLHATYMKTGLGCSWDNNLFGDIGRYRIDRVTDCDLTPSNYLLPYVSVDKNLNVEKTVLAIENRLLEWSKGDEGQRELMLDVCLRHKDRLPRGFKITRVIPFVYKVSISNGDDDLVVAYLKTSDVYYSGDLLMVHPKDATFSHWRASTTFERWIDGSAAFDSSLKTAITETLDATDKSLLDHRIASEECIKSLDNQIATLERTRQEALTTL